MKIPNRDWWCLFLLWLGLSTMSILGPPRTEPYVPTLLDVLVWVGVTGIFSLFALVGLALLVAYVSKE
jgi:hypothetical protein